MSRGKSLRRFAKGPLMALALILLVLTLSSCASTRRGYVSSLWDLADSVWVIVHRVEAVAAEIHQNPQLWQDDSWIQQAVHLCTDVITASDEVDDLKPPWDMQGIHDAGVKLLGEMRSYAQKMRLYFSTGRASYRTEAVRHLNAATLRESDVEKAEARRPVWYVELPMLGLFGAAVPSVFYRMFVKNPRVKGLSKVIVLLTCMAITFGVKYYLFRQTGDAIAAVLYEGALIWLFTKPTLETISGLFLFEIGHLVLTVRQLNLDDDHWFVIIFGLTIYYMIRVVSAVQEKEAPVIESE